MSNPSRLEVRVTYRGTPHATRCLRPGESYVIGATRRADAPVPADVIAGDDFTLVAPARNEFDDHFVVNVTPAMDGEVTAGDQLVPLAGWIAAHGPQIALGAGTTLALRCGDLHFVITPTTAPEVVGHPPVVLKWSEQKYTAGSALGLLLVVLIVSMVPPDVKALAGDHIGAELRFTDFTIAPLEPPPPPRGPGGGKSLDQAGKRHTGPEGRMGDRRRKPTDAGRLALGGRTQPQLAKQQREQEIAEMGVLGVIAAGKGDVLASVFGRESALGEDPATVLGNLVAPTTGAAYGLGALGVVGTGAGGGGDGEATIGTGALGTIGGYRGERAAGIGPAGGGRLLTRRAGPAPDFIAGQPTVRGALDKDIIRRIIRRHLNEVKYCYEQELPRKQDLAGRVAVNFTIASTGQVAAAVIESSTMGNARVESCLVGAVRRWEFPQPAGGGIVIATYPFNFMTTGRTE